MGCNCGSSKIDPVTGRRVKNDSNGGKGYIYTGADGKEVLFSSKHTAEVEKVRLGGTGSVRPAT